MKSEEFTGKHNPLKVAMGLSLLTTVIMLVGKLSAYFITHSAAIFSDAAESIFHVAATGLAALSLWYASIPADRGHPYGHGKISFFSAGFEGALILVAALGVIYTGIREFIVGPELSDLGWGLGIISFLTLVNLALGLFLIHTGKKFNSLIVEANGRHVLTDMWTSAGVVIGVALVMVTDLHWLDPIVAILMGLNILRTAIQLILQSFHGLMDVADQGITEQLRSCMQRAVDDNMILGFHQLRHRQVSDEIWVEVHLLFPGQMTMSQAHRKVSVVEGLIAALFPKEIVHVTSHLEPVDHERAHPGGHPNLQDPLEHKS